MESAEAATRTAVLEHLEAFNAHDTERLLAGLDEGIVWATGQEIWTGRASLVRVFDPGLWAMAPCLEVTRLVVEGDTAAMECTERLTIDGREFEFPIGVFLTVRDGRLLRVKVDREGTVDLPD